MGTLVIYDVSAGCRELKRKLFGCRTRPQLHPTKESHYQKEISAERCNPIPTKLVIPLKYRSF